MLDETSTSPTPTRDVSLICADCDEAFTWTAGEQVFYAQRNFIAPKRCQACRLERRLARDATR